MWTIQSGANAASAADTSPRLRPSTQMRWYSIRDATVMFESSSGYGAFAAERQFRRGSRHSGTLEKRLHWPYLACLGLAYNHCVIEMDGYANLGISRPDLRSVGRPHPPRHPGAAGDGRGHSDGTRQAVRDEPASHFQTSESA